MGLGCRMAPSRLSQMTRAVDLAAPDSAAVSATGGGGSGARHRRVFSADSADLAEFDVDAARSVPPPVRRTRCAHPLPQILISDPSLTSSKPTPSPSHFTSTKTTE